jgi:uncharacterized tellurite resistance protein B-like protein
MEETVLSLASLEMASLESVLALVVLTARADGRLDDAEVADFKVQVVEASGGRIDAALADVMFDALYAGLASEDPESRLRRIRAKLRDPGMRQAALGMAARIAMADGVFHIDEARFLERAAEVLEIAPETAREIIAKARAGERA